MIAGYTGLGKTYLALSIAYAIASGGELLGWETGGRPRKVLYLDGEMGTVDMQDRLVAIHAAAAKDRNGDAKAADANLIIVHAGDLENGIPNLHERAGQRWVEGLLKETGATVLILDNLSCLFSSEHEENTAESWVEPQRWLLKLRRDGHSVIFLHHTGKPNEETGKTKQRGTSKREDILNTSILLGAGVGKKDAGSSFIVNFPKHRGFLPVEPFGVRIEDAEGECRLTRTGNITEQIKKMQRDGLNQTQIGQFFGVNQGTISRWLKEGKKTPANDDMQAEAAVHNKRGR